MEKGRQDDTHSLWGDVSLCPPKSLMQTEDIKSKKTRVPTVTTVVCIPCDVQLYFSYYLIFSSSGSHLSDIQEIFPVFSSPLMMFLELQCALELGSLHSQRECWV